MEEILTTSFTLLHLALDLCIGIGVLVAEAEVLQLGLDGEEPEAVGQRCVEEGGFASDSSSRACACCAGGRRS